MRGLPNPSTCQELPAPPRQKPGSVKQHLVVLGGGMSAHYLAVRLIEKLGLRRFSLTIVSEEHQPPYDRVNLASIIEGTPPKDLWLHPLSWYHEHDISIHLGQKVQSVDTKSKTIYTHQGLRLQYDHLVFATGSSPYKPPIPGSDLSRVMTFRTADEAQKIAESIRAQSRVMVIGGGLLGLETGRVLARQRCVIEIIEAAPQLLPRQLDEDGATMLATQVQDLGICLKLGLTVSHIEDREQQLHVTLSDGSTHRYDMVVIATGTRPRDELAQQAGISCHERGGILVDDYLRTSDPHVWAIGECVSHRQRTYGFVSPCQDMAGILASNLLQRKGTFKGTAPAARLKIDEVPMVTVGEGSTHTDQTHVVSWTAPNQYRRLVLRNQRIVGATAIGPSPDFPQLQMAIARGKRPAERHLQRFRTEGKLWPLREIQDVRHWPNQAVVCSCTGITCGQLRSQLSLGISSPHQLSEKTGAATVCGSCKPLLETLAGGPVSALPSTRSTLLAALGSIALLLLSIRAITGPLSFSTSSQEAAWDFLWRSTQNKQISGYVLLSLCLASLLLSVRKRLPRFTNGSISFWRTLHVSLGLSALSFTGIHTGFRMGVNLNFALMMSFILVIISGALLTFVAASERQLGYYSGTIKRLTTNLHILFFWPWPVLVIFHILSSYYY